MLNYAKISVNEQSILKLSAGIAKPKIAPFQYTQKPSKISKKQMTERYKSGIVFHSDIGHFFEQIPNIETFTQSYDHFKNFLRTPKNSALFYAEIRMATDGLQSKLADYFSNEQIQQLLQSVPPINASAQQLLDNMPTHEQIQQLLQSVPPINTDVQQLLNNIPEHNKVKQLLNDGLLTNEQIQQLSQRIPTNEEVQQLLNKSGMEDDQKQKLLKNIITKEILISLTENLPKDKIFIPKTSGRTLLSIITSNFVWLVKNFAQCETS